MDLICIVCSEPWEINSLHDEAEEQGITFEEMWKKFRNEGCKAFMYAEHNSSYSLDAEAVEQREAAALIMDMMGDDVDAAAAFMEDFGLT